MRINDSALAHGITVEEIHAVIAYYERRTPLPARRPGAEPVLYIGALNTNEPYIEVIHDQAQDEVFHAMLLRISVAINADIAHLIDLGRIAERQRR